MTESTTTSDPAGGGAAEQAEREALIVELVSRSGRAEGTCTVARAHREGILHRAFSVVLHDGHGRVLLQQRSQHKLRFPGRWANACCGHPGPGQDLQEAASERVRAETGLHVAVFAAAGAFVYRAVDGVSGHVEHEYDHVLLGRVDAGRRPAPDPQEIARLGWFTVEAVQGILDGVAADGEHRDPAPWLRGVHALSATRLTAAAAADTEREAAS